MSENVHRIEGQISEDSNEGEDCEDEQTLHDSLDEKAKPTKTVASLDAEGGVPKSRISVTDASLKNGISSPERTEKTTSPAKEKAVDVQVHTKEKNRNEDVPREKALVLFSYKAEHDDELDLVEGEEVVVLEKDIEDPGWFRGEKHGKTGVFPDNFVRLVPQQRPKKPPPPSREVLARSIHMSGSVSPPPDEGHLTHSSDNISTSTDTLTTESPNRPPPLPPKEGPRPVGPKPGKIGLGAIPNIGQLRSMLKSPTGATEGAAPARSLFYISAPSTEADSSLLIVPEPGASVTTVLFHPTKNRARPNRTHDHRPKREVILGESATINTPQMSPQKDGSETSKSEALHDNTIISPKPSPPKQAPLSVAIPNNNVGVKHPVSTADVKTKPVVSPAQPVWEKRNSVEHSVCSEERYQKLDAEAGGNRQLPKRQPPAVPPPIAKRPPPAVPKKSPAIAGLVMTSHHADSKSDSATPEAARCSPVPSVVSTSKDSDSSTRGSLFTLSESIDAQMKYNVSEGALAAVNARCDRLDKLIQDMRRDLNSAQNDVRRLTVELDEEKKARLSVQVDLERVRKLLDRQQTLPPAYPPLQPPGRPPPPHSDQNSLPATAI